MTEQTSWNPGEPASPPPAPPVPPTPNGKYRRRGGIGVGVVLIALGILFLAAQWIPGVAWPQLWPLILVLIGAIMLVTPDPRDGWGLSRFMDGLGTVILGGVLLGNTTGYISWGVWWTLVTLWPVLLIAAGIGIIGRGVGQSWVRAIGTLVLWAALAYAVATALTGQGGLRPIAPVFQQAGGVPFSYAEPLGSTRRATLAFDAGAGDITMNASTNGDLVSVTGASHIGKPAFATSRSGDRTDVTIGVGDSHGAVLGPDFSTGRVDVGLSDAVPWDMTINAGASNLSADFSRVKLSALTLKTGVSNDDIKLGPLSDEAPKPAVDIKSGVAAVTVSVPKGTPARILSSSGLTDLSVADAFKQTGSGVWLTDGKTAERGYDIQVESGVGSVSIQTY